MKPVYQIDDKNEQKNIEERAGDLESKHWTLS